MLRVQTMVAKSSIHGIGLFAKQRIPKGTLIWRYDPQQDHFITDEEFARLEDPETKEVMQFYGYRDPKMPAGLILCQDHAKHFNFSRNPNCGELHDGGEPETYALCDIEVGEELTFSALEDLSAVTRAGHEHFL